MDTPRAKPPQLIHSLRPDKSILALALSSASLFVAVEEGEILVSKAEAEIDDVEPV
jgi:hypothetical protein